MSETNQMTIAAYEQGVKAYIAGSPQEVSGSLKDWIDAGLTHLEKDAKILEIGSGTGKDAAYIESCGYVVERTDVTEAFVDLLRSKGYPARVLDVLQDELGQNRDMIFADAVLLHFTEAELMTIFGKVFQSLAEEGLFLFTLKVGEGEEITDRKLGAKRYFHYWQQAQIEERLLQTGFEEVTIIQTADHLGRDRHDYMFVTAKKGVAI